MRRMQEWPVQTLHRSKVRWGMATRTAVDRVTNDRVTDRIEMDTYLVGPSGCDRHADQRHSPQMLRGRHASHGVAGSPRTSGDLLSLNRVTTEREVDSSARLDISPHEGTVALVDLTFLELARELGMRAVMFGDDHQS